MKKPYIQPESQLFVINLTENIADQSGPGESPPDLEELPGGVTAEWIAGKLYYTGVLESEVILAPSQLTYTQEIMKYFLSTGGNPQLLICGG